KRRSGRDRTRADVDRPRSAPDELAHGRAHSSRGASGADAMTLRLTVPGSKSMTQRGLVLGALGQDSCVVQGAVDCDDSRRLTGLLQSLGTRITWSGDRIEIQPAPLRGEGQRVDCGNAGTCVRFGACLALATEGGFVLDGNERMRQRPIGAL